MHVPAGLPTDDLIGQLLSEQRDLTAVERFSQRHAQADSPLRESRYRELLPASPPGDGEQYAFEVDLDACTGCKACVTACHSLNGLDEAETWRNVGLLQGGSADGPSLVHVTSSCHHCIEPACMIGCPVNAYEKDPVTGVVKHLDDQCIGCQYCTLTCPYEAPQYNAEKGIVRKCDMCSDRLESGEAPACVQACPNSAIRIRLVGREETLQSGEAGQFLPGAPDPAFTLPTTVYKTDRSFPRNLLPADYYRAAPQHGHLALVVMLVLTQLSVGVFLVAALLTQSNVAAFGEIRLKFAGTAMAVGLLGMGAAVFHLGRPLYAYRALLGLRRSWLSREILAFNLYAAAAVGCATATALEVWSPEAGWSRLAAALQWSAAATGAAGVVCSGYIYAATGRECWRLSSTLWRFFGTAAVLGTAGALSLIATAALVQPRSIPRLDDLRMLLGLLGAAAAGKLWFELAVLARLNDKQMSVGKRTALLLTGDLSLALFKRVFFGALGGVVLPLLLFHQNRAFETAPAFAALCCLVILVCNVAGELLERYLFFAAAAAPKMPGGMVR